MAIENGTDIVIQMKPVSSGSYKTVYGLTSNAAQISRALRDTTTKQSGGWKAQEFGLGEGSFSLECKYDPAADGATYYKWSDFLTALTGKTKLLAKFTDSVSGHTQITATVLVVNAPITAPLEDNATFTVELSWDGAPTIDTV